MPARPTAEDEPKKRRPPPRKKKPANGDDPPALRSVRSADDIEAELSKPTLAAPAGADDDDPTKGEWLFKQNEMVLGPVSAIVLVERIKTGELSADTPIA